MLLDTCAVLWLAAGSKEISAVARSRIESASAVYVSAISGFEIVQKCRTGKLELSQAPSDWLRAVLKHHDLSVVPLDMDVCLAAADLPLIHRDPCDRFIIATAKLNGWPVVSSDSRFKEYGIETLI